MYRVGLILLATVLLRPDAGLAQSGTVSIKQGHRVRITAPSVGLVQAVGTVLDASDAVLVVHFEDADAVGTVYRPWITGLDVSIRRNSRIAEGAAIGWAVGSIVDEVTQEGPKQFEQRSAFQVSHRGLTAFGGEVNGTSGLVVGAVVGMKKHDQWLSVMIPEDDPFELRPREGQEQECETPIRVIVSERRRGPGDRLLSSFGRINSIGGSSRVPRSGFSSPSLNCR